METIQDIRRANVVLLLQEIAQELGTERGAAAELSRRTGVPGPQISQFVARKTYADGGLRSLGDRSARKLEAGMRKPKGWLDATHVEVSDQERQLLQDLRGLTAEQRQMMAAQVRELARLNRSMGGDKPAISTTE